MQPIAPPRPMLDVQQLCKTFELHLLDGQRIEPLVNVSFAVAPGTLCLISGKSGAGKTSILKCVYRTYLTTRGAIWYDSQLFGRIDLASADERVVGVLREHEIGYCAQFLKVLPRVSALDVAAEPMVKRGIAPDEARTTAAGWLRRLGIAENRWNAYPVTFSGGEQQRLNLIRALIAAPRLLLLDEPTASLDIYSKENVQAMIAEAKAGGVTIVVVTHDTPAFTNLADSVYTLDPEAVHPA